MCGSVTTKIGDIILDFNMASEIITFDVIRSDKKDSSVLETAKAFLKETYSFWRISHFSSNLHKLYIKFQKTKNAFLGG